MLILPKAFALTRKLGVAQAAIADMANDCGIAPKATIEFMARQVDEDRRYRRCFGVFIKADFRATQSTLSLSYSGRNVEACSMYTPKVFVLFQKELSKGHDCNLNKLGESGIITEYDISPYGKEDQHHLVTYDSSTDMALCSCKKFKFVGLLCSHALKVLSSNHVMRIPEKYILKRWTKNAKSGSTTTCAWTSLIEDPKAMMGRRYKELCRLCTQLATRAAETEETYNIALDCLKKVAEEVDASLTGESFHGTLNADNSASLENEATLGEGIEKRVIGSKVKERATGRSSERQEMLLKGPLSLKELQYII
ncbi:protein FAR1-RELATED SEQUENCE 9-like [Rhododendron vialii]|uniref:protein FAR1-RELATED SEQUENCE 9-like n=1 Tax=Rhododendron vialii TaxID=182163 RepID=UPI00265F0691|nr:protein FAR1-RELATED SEQUENCE 9-like [Rhododendron vialii]